MYSLNAIPLLFKNLTFSKQSGFRPYYSNESILIKIADDWLEAMEQGLFTRAIL